MVTLLRQFETLKSAGKDVAFATLIVSDGGSSKRVGSRMWITADNMRVGSLTVGGCVDQEIAEIAPHVISTGEPRRLTVDLSSEDGFEAGMTCAASVEVFVERVALSDPNATGLKAFEAIQKAQLDRRRAVLVSALDDRGTCLVITEDEIIGDSPPGLPLEDLRQTLDEKDGTAGVMHLHDPDQDVFFEVIGAVPRLVIIGAAPITEPLASLAGSVGFRTLLVESLEERVGERLRTIVDEIQIGIPSELCRALPVDGETFIVIVAHDYKFEVPVLSVLAEKPFAYLGMVAGKRRGRAVLEFVEARGISESHLASVRTPVGLNLGGSQPGEIAISIMAEILKVRYGKPTRK